MKNSFPVRSFSWHGRTFHVTHTESQGQGVPPTLFTAAVCPCDIKQTHTTWQLWSQGTNNVTASQAPRQPALPAGSQWIRFLIFLKGFGLGHEVRCKDVTSLIFTCLLLCCLYTGLVDELLQNYKMKRKKKAIKDESVFEWKNKRTS